MTSNASTVKREVISLGTAKAERGPEIDMIEEADLGLQEGIEEMGEEMAIGTEGEETGLQGEDMTTPDLTLEVEGMGEETTEMMTEVIDEIGEARKEDLETTIEGMILEIRTRRETGLTLTRVETTEGTTDLRKDLRTLLEDLTRADGKIAGMLEEVHLRVEVMKP